jgi:nucleotide-binding universal stress UspA family protein
VASFAVRPLASLAGGVEESAEDLVVARWSAQVGALVRASLGDEAGGEAGGVATRLETVVGQGNTWAEAVGAVPWSAGDLLVVGASSSAISSFLLGSHAAKVVRSSPVPVYLVPRTLHG